MPFLLSFHIPCFQIIFQPFVYLIVVRFSYTQIFRPFFGGFYGFQGCIIPAFAELIHCLVEVSSTIYGSAGIGTFVR